MDLTDKEFEDEVRRIARLLWPSAEYNGAAMLDGQERDGVFVTDDAVHLVECTVSRRKDKADEDGTKLAKLAPKMGAKHPTKIVKCWFITSEEPTADQRAVIDTKKVSIVCVSFDQFRSKLVDAKSYIAHRREYAFGSARDLETDKFRVDMELTRFRGHLRMWEGVQDGKAKTVFSRVAAGAGAAGTSGANA